MFRQMVEDTPKKLIKTLILKPTLFLVRVLEKVFYSIWNLSRQIISTLLELESKL